MRPAEFTAQCVFVREGKIELTHISDICDCKPLPVVLTHKIGEFLNQSVTVFSMVCSALLVNNGLSNLPIGFDHGITRGLINFVTCRINNSSNLVVESAVHLIFPLFDIRPDISDILQLCLTPTAKKVRTAYYFAFGLKSTEYPTHCVLFSGISYIIFAQCRKPAKH